MLQEDTHTGIRTLRALVQTSSMKRASSEGILPSMGHHKSRTMVYNAPPTQDRGSVPEIGDLDQQKM